MHLEVDVSPAEGVRRPLDRLIRPVEAVAGVAAVRRGEGEVGSVVREGRVSGKVAVQVRLRSDRPELRQGGDVAVGAVVGISKIFTLLEYNPMDNSNGFNLSIADFIKNIF